MADKDIREILNNCKIEITDIEKKLIDNFDFFLKNLNLYQKKAVISNKDTILTLAGPGTGKTTVLTKRIEFLVKFCGVSPQNILAITFTKKAKEEMKKRLEIVRIKNVNIETFNSFSEKFLKKYKKGKVINFLEKKNLLKKTIIEINFDYEKFFDYYFSKKDFKDENEKFNQFTADTFSILDFLKNTKINFIPFYNSLTGIEKKLGKEYFLLIKKLDEKLKKNNYRDFSDQVIEAIDLLKEFKERKKELIPSYEHILIDEFQDINKVQFELINLINWKNIFVVGDPRQAIYSWRGATDFFINKFPNYFKNPEIIYLSKNYRSSKNIVEVANIIVKELNFPNIESTKEDEGEIYLEKFDTFNNEINYIIKKIREIKEKNEVFILSRTNKILEKIAENFKENNIKFKIKKDIDEEIFLKENEVLLSTIHSIKGLEAENVFIVEVNNIYFPNRVKDNFIQEALNNYFSYNKEKEELRLLYVGITRAKKKLFLLYTEVKSAFLTDEINLYTKNLLKSYKSEIIFKNKSLQKLQIKELRAKIANILGVKTSEIIDNRTIEQLLELQPKTKEELKELNINSFFLNKFADEILKIFR